VNKFSAFCNVLSEKERAQQTTDYKSKWHKVLFSDARSVILFVYDGFATTYTVEQLMSDILFEKFGTWNFKIGNHPLVLVWLHDWKLSSRKIDLETRDLIARSNHLEATVAKAKAYIQKVQSRYTDVLGELESAKEEVINSQVQLENLKYATIYSMKTKD
jgi:hypothetical protein